jgi:excinuclease ABC subunit B
VNFRLISNYYPAGDQPSAIAKLTANIQSGKNKQVLLGVTGSGKTFTVANVIQNTQLPTLVISHNKTLAGQLYQEFKELFPENKVSYFVSYYDYYQPEAYIPASDTYIEKEVQINDLIDKLRLQASSNLFSGTDNITIASVSCIYNIGDPSQFGAHTLEIFIGKLYPRRQLFEDFVKLYYTRSEMEFKRSKFRVRGNLIDVWPAYMDDYISLEFDNNKLISINQLNPLTGKIINLEQFFLYPAKQYVSGGVDEEIFKKIRADKEKQVKFFESQNRPLEAHRIDQRVRIRFRNASRSRLHKWYRKLFNLF